MPPGRVEELACEVGRGLDRLFRPARRPLRPVEGELLIEHVGAVERDEGPQDRREAAGRQAGGFEQLGDPTEGVGPDRVRYLPSPLRGLSRTLSGNFTRSFRYIEHCGRS